MQKRITALLLAACLTLTCAPGAWAVEPGDGQLPETGIESEERSVEDTTVPAEDTPVMQDIPAPAENEDAPQEREPHEPENSESGSEEKGESTGESTDTPTATDEVEADGGKTGGNKPDGTEDPISPEERDAANEELQSWWNKLAQFHITPLVYDEAGEKPADLDNIAVNDTLTVYYAAYRYENNQIVTCTPGDITAALQREDWKISVNPGIAADAAAIKFEAIEAADKELVPGLTNGNRYNVTHAYWRQTITVTSAGSAQLMCGLKLTVDGTELDTANGESVPFTVREKPRAGGAKTLNDAFGKLTVSFDRSPGELLVGDTIKVSLGGNTADGEMLDKIREFVAGLDLQPEKVSIGWSPLYESDTAIFGAEKQTGECQANYDNYALFGSVSFTATAGGRCTLVFALYYDGSLVKTIEASFRAMRKDSLIKISEENFPDGNLRDALRKMDRNQDGFIDVNGNGEFNGYMNLSGRGIKDLTGLDKFVDIAYLDVSYNELTALDVSSFQNLWYLDCTNNRLETLDVSSDPLLSALYCGGNRLKTLNVDGNAKLQYLNCSGNELTDLSLQNKPRLVMLLIGGNALEELDLSGCPGIAQTDMVLTDGRCYWQQVRTSAPMTCSAFKEGYTIDLSKVFVRVDTLSGINSGSIKLFDAYDPDKAPLTVKNGEVFILDGVGSMPSLLAYECKTGGQGPAATMQVRIAVEMTQQFVTVKGPEGITYIDGRTDAGFATSAPANTIKQVLVDGVPVPENAYTVEAKALTGGLVTVVTVKADWLAEQKFTNAEHLFELTGDRVYGYACFETLKVAAQIPSECVESGEQEKVEAVLEQAAAEQYKTELNDSDTLKVVLNIKPNNAPADKNAFETYAPDDVLTFYDITIEVIQVDSGNSEKSLGTIPAVKEPIRLRLKAPGDEGFIYVLHKHGSAPVTDVEGCCLDSGYICFSSDTFSTFAVAASKDLSKATLKDIPDQTYTGSAFEPEIEFTNYNGKLPVKGTDYDVTYTNNVGPGDATVTITARGGTYTGSKTVHFKINSASGGGSGSGNSESKGPAAEETAEAESTPISAPAAPAVYTGTIPQTADEFPLSGAMTAFGISLAGLGALLLLRKKQR